MEQGRVILKAGRDKVVRGGNPWVFSQAIDRVEPAGLQAGALIELCDVEGRFVALGHFNPTTTIAVRIISWNPGQEMRALLEQRLTDALALRSRVVGADSNCYRVVNGDGDGLSGLVVDRYADVLVVQILSAGMDRLRDEIVAMLSERLSPRSILERSVGAVRRREGLVDRCAVLWGEPVSKAVAVENQIRVEVDFEHGQKSGYFLDQRENRVRFAAFARGASVLDACCYTGGFTLAALRAGASRVVAVDSSARALAGLKHNLALNGLAPQSVELVQADIRSYLASATERFDLAVLDPPPLARSRKDTVHALSLYTELNYQAVRLLAAGGFLMTFSCSAHVRGEDFVRAVRFGLARGQRVLRLLAHLGAGPDHPTLLGHAEGEYLTGLLLADLG